MGSGRKSASPKARQDLEVRLPPQKRKVRSAVGEDAPATKKQKSPKTVRFSEAISHDEHPSARGPTLNADDGLSEDLSKGVPVTIDLTQEDSTSSESPLSEIHNPLGNLSSLNSAPVPPLALSDQGILSDSTDVDTGSWEDASSVNESATSLQEAHGENTDSSHKCQYDDGVITTNTENPEDRTPPFKRSNQTPAIFTPPHDHQSAMGDHHAQDYRRLKTDAWKWTLTHFPFNTTSPDLLALCTSSPQLMEYANYLSALGSSYSSWEEVFSRERPFLVYSVLGKILEVHVFGSEMFGGTEEQLQQLRDLDTKMMMDDGKFTSSFSFKAPLTTSTE